ncbi:MAG: Error-prone DNA polymerase [Pseudidiomarina mangrovi]|nr:MAG: Error-prone DNA polymerase [Pseudidiomarina mangrovi]
MAGSPNWAPVALHCRSSYSFLRAASQPKELVQRAIELGYQALAITDECSLAGAVKAYVAARNSPLRLIIGSEFQLPELGCLILLVQHHQGYAQLCALITQARRRAEKGSYQLSHQQFLAASSELSDCLLLWRPASEAAFAEYHELLQQAFPERLWLAYSRHYQANDAEQYRRYVQYHQQSGIPVLAACEVYYHQPERQPLYDVMTAIRCGQAVTEVVEQLLPNQEFCLRSSSELARCYPMAWLAEASQLSQRCQFNMSELSYQYPAELVPAGRSADDYLRELTYAGVKQRFPAGLRSDVQEKLEKELGLIAQLGYAYFFLTIHDLVQFAQQRGILYQGRGSAANSVVCYCLQITAVNPDQIDVLFERFISVERDEPPDIDVDFEHQRREEIIQYIYQKYSRERAALAATVICYRLRSAFRDVGKALGFSEPELAHYMRHIDRRDHQLDWQQQLQQQVPQLVSTSRGRWLLQLTEQLRGMPRHLSQHVGGFVIAATSLTQLVPVENASMPDRTVIQWDKDDIETLKLIKVDVLALGMLSALRKMFELVAQHHQRPLDLASLPSDDPAVYEMLQRGDSIGVFQVESRAQMNMLPRLKPARFYDLVVQIAIVRPGPIQGDMVHPYLRRRAGLEAVTYPSAAVQSVLERTLGVPIFQEQVIKLAMVAAGFSGGEADQLRRAMANWKSSGELRQFEQRLIDGMLARGYSSEFAQRIYQQICGFGEYGFPESHSASFANLAYASAWMKCHYPAAFYCALLNSLPMGFYSAGQLIADANRHHIPVLPADIQSSQWHHQLVPLQAQLAIRLGLCIIKGLNGERCRELLAQRPAGGYQQLQQLRQLGWSAAELQQLAAADVLSKLSGHRYQSQWQSMALAHEQLPLFAQVSDSDDDTMLPAPLEYHDIGADYSSTGLSLRRHPLALLREQGLLKGCRTAAELPLLRHQQVVEVAGIVTCRQRPGTASGVTFITLEDETGLVNVVVWLATARQFKQPYLTARLLRVRGILERHGEVIHIIAGRLQDGSAALDQHQLETKRSRDFH